MYHEEFITQPSILCLFGLKQYEMWKSGAIRQQDFFVLDKKDGRTCAPVDTWLFMHQKKEKWLKELYYSKAHAAVMNIVLDATKNPLLSPLQTSDIIASLNAESQMLPQFWRWQLLVLLRQRVQRSCPPRLTAVTMKSNLVRRLLWDHHHPLS